MKLITSSAPTFFRSVTVKVPEIRSNVAPVPKMSCRVELTVKLTAPLAVVEPLSPEMLSDGTHVISTTVLGLSVTVISDIPHGVLEVDVTAMAAVVHVDPITSSTSPFGCTPDTVRG